jgi:hypothetical protein
VSDINILNIRKVTFLILLAVGLSSCASYMPDQSGRNYIDYKAKTIEGPVAQSNFRIAILPFANNSGTLQLRSEAAKQENEYYQFSNLLPWVLAEELRHNKVGAVVHVAPSLIDDYDLVIRGEWAVMETIEKSVGTTIKASFSLFRPNEPKPLYEKLYQDEHEKKLWVNISLTEKVIFIRQSAHNFILDSQPVISALTSKLNDKSRRFAYYQHLDPEIKALTSSISKNKRIGNKRAADQLFVEYKSRLSYLEAYRAKEWEVLVNQNSYRENTYRERLQEVARYVREKSRLKAEIAKQKAAHKAAAKKQRNSALAAILMGAQAASKRGASNSAVLSSALNDMGTALQRLPQPPPLQIDDSMLNQKIDLRGLHDFSTDTFGKLEGKSLSDIRSKFLALYKRKTNDLSMYY